GGGAGQLEPLAEDLVRFGGVDDDVAVAVVGAGLRHAHLLVPAVLAGDGVGLDGEREVLVDAGLFPPDAARVGILALEGANAVDSGDSAPPRALVWTDRP